ncbi:MAG: GDP-mannose 4,6-dehydratase [Magnetococcales bacterium]|nr:GDP-mannose 4,6-dehydratase [Magnetococcales bacterium]
MMRILITGVTGFAGSHMLDYILSLGEDHQIFGVKRWHLSRMDHIRHQLDHITMVDCDLTDPVGVRHLIDQVRPDVLFHFAAESFIAPSWKHPIRYMQVNYNATVHLLDAIHHFKLPTIVHIPASGDEYGEVHAEELPIRPETMLRPLNPYAVSKIAQNLIGYVYYKSYGLHVIRTRVFNHEGPRREKVFGLPWYAYQIARIEAGLQEPLLKVGNIDTRRNFTHIQDIVRAYWLAVQKCKSEEVYLIGSEDEDSIHTFREALEMLIALSTAGGIHYEIDPIYVRPTNTPLLIADTSQFTQMTGWKPRIPFSQILVDILAYWRGRVSMQLD